MLIEVQKIRERGHQYGPAANPQKPDEHSDYQPKHNCDYNHPASSRELTAYGCAVLYLKKICLREMSRATFLGFEDHFRQRRISAVRDADSRVPNADPFRMAQGSPM